jgi:hypothetical protein
LNAAINSMESTPNQNVVTPDNDEAVNTKLQAAFDKQMDKKEAVENKKEMRKEAAAERKQRAAERKSKKSK